ncbi:MAG: C40 family peptidase [Bacteroidales bacterium]|nr:C40 family peptidase [Bacteroidales bacterium]
MTIRKLLFCCALLALLAGCSQKYAMTADDMARTLPLPRALDDDRERKDYGICRLSVMNIREEPAYEAEMGTQMLMGAICWIIERKDGWAMITTPEGYVAWVTEGSLVFTGADGAMAWKAAPRLIVTAHYTPLLTAPSRSAAVVRDAVCGCIVAKVARKGNYYRCRLPDGVEAYIAARDVADCRDYFASQHPSGGDIVATAKRYMGVPYLWAGSSGKGLDCSGLSQRVYMERGILLPRNASQQAEVGDEVDITGGWSNLQPGDLLFFGRPRANGSVGIYHVAIYIGGGQFIHSSGGLVHVNSLSPDRDDYFSGVANIVSARRILGSDDAASSLIINNGWYF